MVYAPWPSPLARAVRSLGPGAPSVVRGTGMLLHQAVVQVELMTGRRPAPEDLLAGLPADLLTLHDLGSTTKES